MKKKKIYKLDKNKPEHDFIIDLFLRNEGIKETIKFLAETSIKLNNEAWEYTFSFLKLKAEKKYSFNHKKNEIKEI